jgi:hypothetical protein
MKDLSEMAAGRRAITVLEKLIVPVFSLIRGGGLSALLRATSNQQTTMNKQAPRPGKFQSGAAALPACGQ